MSHSRAMLKPDRGLQARMLLTLLLLAGVYLGAIVALTLTNAEMFAVIVPVAVFALVQILLSDRAVLAALGARIVSPREAPELHGIVERLCVQADMPKPRVAVADTSVPNAFAVGRSRKTSAVCASTGMMRALTPSELQAVMAHELSHVRNRDVLVITVVSFFATVALMIMLLVRFSWRLFLGLALLALPFWVLSSFLLLALSRYREYVADREAALTTGKPSALASALSKIAGGLGGIPAEDLRATRALNAFFVVPTSVKRGPREFWSTHPPIEQRLARLERLEIELSGSGR